LNPLYLLVSASALSQVVFMSAQFTLLLHALHLNISPVTAGLLISLAGVGPALIAANIGKLIDRRGGRSLMMLSLLGQVGGGLLLYAFTALPVLFAASFINGVCFIVFRVGSQHAIGSLGNHQDRAANYGVLGLGYSASAIAAPLGSGFAIEHFGHAATFLALALIPLIPLAMTWGGALRIPGASAAAASAPSRGSAFALLGDAKLRRVLLTTVLMGGAWDVFVFLIPLYGSQLQLSASQIGLMAGIFASGALFVRALTGLLLRRFTAWQVLIMALVLSAATFFIYPALATMGPLLAVAFIAGMGMGAALPVTMALAFDAAPAHRSGEVIGLRLGLSMANTALLPALCGALGAAFGVALVYWIEGASLVLGAWINRRHWQRRAA
jgi:predicted MFS family arabinose efflux permease